MDNVLPFVELDRAFAPVRKDAEASPDLGLFWGRKFGGWLDWNELRKHRRVVLLAEASSGKSAEFRNQTEQLQASGKSAFCVRIEDLADEGFRASLDTGSLKQFDRWHRSDADAWFFLDSIDEARLNRKSLQTALRHFSKELGQSVERTCIFISCRVTDWQGQEDRNLISQWLPAWERPLLVERRSAGRAALLDPIFNNQESSKPQVATEKKSSDLLVVRLAPLSDQQWRALAVAGGVSDVDAFVSAIVRAGLDVFAERPGDLLNLIDYWRQHGRFGSLSAMVESGISKKLRELNPFRPDNEALSSSRVRDGAERIAAALTFGKSFTLRAPSYDPDPSLSTGALDPALILIDWSEAERNALLRRGVFAPATYGRVRFHHRSTQEYLTASWLNRLLLNNCPRSEIWNQIFVTKYGIETIVPSLRPATAWLALLRPEFTQEIIRREPLVLIQYGDPSSLPLDIRKKLLLEYAVKHSRSEISDDAIDSKALWLFADTGLASTIRQAWKINNDTNFRADLLRLVREGAIAECNDLARSVASSTNTDDYFRILALQALNACSDHAGLKAATRNLLKRPERASARVASAFALVLYPKYMSTAELLLLIAKSQAQRRQAIEGFAEASEQLVASAPDMASRRTLIGGIAKLCLTPPYVDPYHRVATAHKALAARLYTLAVQETKEVRGTKIPGHLLPLLMTVERAEDRQRGDGKGDDLNQIVRANENVNRALFWADVEEHRKNKGDEKVTRYWHIWFSGGSVLWDLSNKSLEWLYNDLREKGRENDRRIALSGIISVLHRNGKLKAATPKLRKLVAGSKLLTKDLTEYLTPRVESQDDQNHQLLLEERARNQKRKKTRDQESWIRFQREVNSKPHLLSDRKRLTSWADGICRLFFLTQWLEHRTGGHFEKSPWQWRLLEEGFNKKVAEAYRDGMKVLWRVTGPERPKGAPGKAVTVKWQTILAFAGIGLESIEDPEWTSRLGNSEAKIAARHGCLSDQGYPEWIDALIRSHPRIVMPVLTREISSEWLASTRSRSNFLPHYGATGQIILQPVQSALLDLICEHDAGNLLALDRGVDLIRNLSPTQSQRRKLLQTARRRFAHHQRRKNEGYALHYLAALFLLDPDAAILILAGWLEEASSATRKSRAETTFGMFFERRNPLLADALERASVPTLEKLLHLAYRHISPKDDAVHEGVFAPDARDHAENARNQLLSILIKRPGADAYHAIRRAASHRTFAQRAGRFNELAKGKVEQDSEFPAWTESELLRFEREHAAPAKTGGDLLRISVGVLADIVLDLRKGDVSSRALLERAIDEEEVQHWLVEQMNFRSRGRFHAHREAQVSDGDKPDVIISSTSAQCEVAIEVKHGGMGWSTRQLRNALVVQLARDYLKPASRRHGILVVTHHRNKRWLDLTSREPMKFAELIDWLSRLATSTVENENGAVEIACVGIDATASDPPKKDADQRRFAGRRGLSPRATKEFKTRRRSRRS